MSVVFLVFCLGGGGGMNGFGGGKMSCCFVRWDGIMLPNWMDG